MNAIQSWPLATRMMFGLVALGLMGNHAIDATPSSAKKTFVVTSAGDSGAGSLRVVIGEANYWNKAHHNNGAIINFAPTAFGKAHTILLRTGQLPIVTSSIIINGPAAPEARVTLDAQGKSRLFRVVYPDGDLSLSHLTLRNGNGTDDTGKTPGQGDGGAIYNDQGVLNLSDCTLENNDAPGFGGGAVNNDGIGVATLSHCLLRDNRANFGGGALINGAVGKVTIRACTISGNHADGDGGGVNDSGDRMTITDSTVSGNICKYNGGGLSNFVGALLVSGCTISDNRADSSGGIENSGKLTLQNSTVSGNIARFVGGLVNWDTATVGNVTFSGNSCRESSVDILNTGMGTLTLGNTILASVVPGGTLSNPKDAFTKKGGQKILVRGTIHDEGFNLARDNGGGYLTAATDKLNTDPMLDPKGLADNGGPTPTIALLPGSPALSAGHSLLSTDQRGVKRPLVYPGVANAKGGNSSDIGAFELEIAARG